MPLLYSRAASFVEDEFIEDGEDLFAVVVELAQIVAEVAFVLSSVGPFFVEQDGNVNISAERLDGVAAKKKAIKESCFAPGREGIGEIFVWR